MKHLEFHRKPGKLLDESEQVRGIANQSGKATNVFDPVSKPIGTFFEHPGSYVNVEAVHLFGY